MNHNSAENKPCFYKREGLRKKHTGKPNGKSLAMCRTNQPKASRCVMRWPPAKHFCFASSVPLTREMKRDNATTQLIHTHSGNLQLFRLSTLSGAMFGLVA